MRRRFGRGSNPLPILQSILTVESDALTIRPSQPPPSAGIGYLSECYKNSGFSGMANNLKFGPVAVVSVPVRSGREKKRSGRFLVGTGKSEEPGKDGEGWGTGEG